ncbi:hypothetical protein HNP86_001950 [Methanococcus maripaludis]|uniref:RNA polymerase alpha subunit domain-containing protein n=1 Tax=Methanococcus maripaludis TaxID=39152 RepID=A0A7J9NWW8_METMI|nr:hypothetical protein [Methanococcus maripaludis]MBA2851791.1 hypothetical protein [Methanococcus maripaludis]
MNRFSSIVAVREDALQLFQIAKNAKHTGVVQKHDRFGKYNRFLPGTHDTMKRFVIDDLIKRRLHNSIYAKASVNNDLADDEMGVPKTLSETIPVKVLNVEDATEVVFKTGEFDSGKFKHKKIQDYVEGRHFYPGNVVRVNDALFIVSSDGTFEEEIVPVVLLRRGVKDGDEVIIIRHPVKALNTILHKKVKIVDTGDVKQYVLQFTNVTIKYIEGDFDGDAVNALFFDSLHADVDIDKPAEKAGKPTIRLDKKLPPVAESTMNRLDVSAMLNIEEPVPFILAISKSIMGHQLDIDDVKKYISDCRISVLLNQIILYPIARKAIELQDGARLRYLAQKYDMKMNIPDGMDAVVDYDYANEERMSENMEMFIRCYFKGYGPKLSGYVQKLLLDVSGNFSIEDNKLLYRGDTVYTDRELRGKHLIEVIELINALQQDVIGLKHIDAPLSNLDRAYALQRLFQSKTKVKAIGADGCIRIFESFGLNKCAAKMATICLYAITGAELPGTPIVNCHGTKENLTWSWGVADRFIKGDIRETPITYGVTNFIKHNQI